MRLSAKQCSVVVLVVVVVVVSQSVGQSVSQSVPLSARPALFLLCVLLESSSFVRALFALVRQDGPKFGRPGRSRCCSLCAAVPFLLFVHHHRRRHSLLQLSLPFATSACPTKATEAAASTAVEAHLQPASTSCKITSHLY